MIKSPEYIVLSDADAGFSFVDDSTGIVASNESAAASEIAADAAPLALEAATDESNPKPAQGLPKFHLNAYTGAAMVPCNWFDPVVIELSGIKCLNKVTPIRMNHDGDKGVGHANRVYVKDGVLQADGVFSRDTEYSRDIVSSARNGFPWQASVGGRPLKTTWVEEGGTIKANGKNFKGPLCYVSEFELCEISFCDLGADSKTSAIVASQKEEGEMNAMTKNDDRQEHVEQAVENDVQAEAELDVVETETAEPVQVEAARPAPEEEPEEPEPETEEKEDETKATKKKTAAKTNAASRRSTISAENRLKEDRRIAAINSLDAAGYEEMKAQAIEEGWEAAKFAQALRAARNDAGIQNSVPKQGQPAMRNMNEKALEASIVLTVLGSNEAQKYYDEETLNRADDRRHKLLCFRDVFAEALGAHVYKDDLSDRSFVQAAFTTSNLDRIFRNVVNKSLRAGYDTVPEMWRTICSVTSTTDFKPVSTYQVGGDFMYKELPEDSNDIQHAKFGEAEFTNEVKSYGLAFSLTYKQMVNDDLNALQVMPKRLGQGAAETLNYHVFSTLMSNPEIVVDVKKKIARKLFCEENANYVQGTDSAPTDLSIETLTTASTLIETQTSFDGQSIMQQGKYLLVPPALKVKALNLMNSTVLNQTSATPVGTYNPFAGQYEVVTVPYLSNARFPNASAKNWYLFGDPSYVPVIDVAFLKGQEQPVIEQQDASFNTRGLEYRGYYYFGVNPQDYRGAVFMQSAE
jgi:hypothetical protein